ncbi:MAG: carboxy terminal-processing peptidase [Chlorobium limicola]|uniref:Carboxyl-terminal protease n=1 Tax=Chlorobium limicola (strain DSM 245 / NBRC 103803 / 6330) TaxID=290315 RepID=B3ECP4_CHLL2|nr:carboxy terminal-processing peptidase [Chlorobium limicola]ACD90319.1 carboxyl-terminal protease [Chlorobium limicola DSM 245]NTV07492.1 carboxy terminal-processing peptidase [Chlorobium limicola]NTV21194.1 carboxy terminal-processing peptidase [Chlorobium limicola]
MDYHTPAIIKKGLIVVFVSLGCTASAIGKNTTPFLPAVAVVPLKPTETQQAAGKYVTQYLLKNHYRKVPVNDSLSQQIFGRYLEHLDGSKSYFLAGEVSALKKFYGNRIDDEFLQGKTTSGFAVYNQFLRRAKEKMRFMKATADTVRFNFSRQESLDLDRKNDPWPADRKELQALWKKELKYQWLNMKYSEGNDKSIRTELSKTFANRLKLLNQQKPDDALQAYMYAVTTSFDPHTGYFSPDEFENFQIDLSRSLEGIGARLQMESEYTVVNEVIPGGPAFRSNLLKKSDKIIGVGQGAGGEIIDVRGWRINDVVKLIRGKKGTSVRLKIYPASQGGRGPAKIVRLLRDKVDLQEQAARKSIIERERHKIGVITIPSFYLDFEGQKLNVNNYNSTTRDVSRILGELGNAGVDAVIVDLRDNGGGSLEEAVNVTGLFIPTGPVVQISNSSGGKMVLRDEDRRVLYNGPIAVLVNRYSASASEIFAAAIQDYGRGVIIGERTFGKGTVQSLVKLNRPFSFLSKQTELGQLKLTVAKFYRISGGSTQHKGVSPDISIPSLIDTAAIGEDTYTSSLPWSTISKTFYRPVSAISQNEIGRLRQSYQTGIIKDRTSREYVRDLGILNRIRKRKTVSLSEAAFKAENEELKRIEKRWMNEDDSLKEKSYYDFMLNRSADIMNDLIGIKKSGQAGSPARRMLSLN